MRLAAVYTVVVRLLAEIVVDMIEEGLAVSRSYGVQGTQIIMMMKWKLNLDDEKGW